MMKKRILVWLTIAAIVYLVAFVFFYKGTKGNVSKSLEYSGFLTGALAFTMIFTPPEITRAQINATRYNTDVGTGGIIDKLTEQNRHLEEQNKLLDEQNKKLGEQNGDKR